MAEEQEAPASELENLKTLIRGSVQQYILEGQGRGETLLAVGTDAILELENAKWAVLMSALRGYHLHYQERLTEHEQRLAQLEAAVVKMIGQEARDGA